MSDTELAKDLGLVSAMATNVGRTIAMVNALSVSELGTAMPKAD